MSKVCGASLVEQLDPQGKMIQRSIPSISLITSQKGAICVAVNAILNSLWVMLDPLPFDNVMVTMKEEKRAVLEDIERRFPANPEPEEAE